jgi:hypothetical protein
MTFFIFGSLAAIIARHFFASAGDTQGYIFALLTFAAGFAVRPLGALVFGSIGDRTGRKRAFLVTITIMGLATVAVGFLPDFAQIGIAAPYALVGLRVLQGFAIGGEYGGAAIYVAEHSSRKRRGAATGWIQTSATLGLLLALVVILATRKTLGEEIFASWGWRIPFLVSALLLAVSLWIRLKLHESPMFKKMLEEKRGSNAPLSETFLRWSNLKIVLIALVGLLMGQGVVWYTAQFYTQILPGARGAGGTGGGQCVDHRRFRGSAPLHMFFAWLSDYVGRKPVMLFGLALAVVCYFPGFQMLAEAANPALTAAAAKSPVTVAADPSGCSFQFDLIGKAKFVTSCDIAKGALASAGVPYRNAPAASGRGGRACREPMTIVKPRRHVARRGNSESRQGEVHRPTQSRATRAGYPASAKTSASISRRTIEILLVFIVAAAALYGPQAAALVELFPTRIRYTALSVPYHIGVGWFGGFLPATAFAIVAATGNIYAGLWYPVIVAAIGFVVTLLFLPETRGRDIEA